MQVDRGSSWMSGPPDSSTIPKLQGPPPVALGQMGSGNQPPRPASVSYLTCQIFDRSFRLWV